MKEELSVLSMGSEDAEVEGSQLSCPLSVRVLMLSLLKCLSLRLLDGCSKGRTSFVSFYAYLAMN